MKRVYDWKAIWLQILIMTGAFVLPIIFNLADRIGIFFLNENIAIENVFYYWLVKLGDWAIGVVLALFVLRQFRKHNNKQMLNTGNRYHEHLYIGYLFCSKVLGFSKCSLVRVPIAMQFKLVIRDAFAEYYLGNDVDYRVVDEEIIAIELPSTEYTSTINLVLADTYPITRGMLPASTSNLSTLYILRDNKNDARRCFSKSFLDNIQNTVRHLPNNVCGINLYSTLNPKHSDWIARNVFKMAGRCNIQTLTIFPQHNKNGNWNFAETGIKIINV